MAKPLKATDAIALMADIYQSHLTVAPYPKHHAIQAVAEYAAAERQAAIVAWLRTLREGEFDAAAAAIESGEWKGQG